MYADDFDVWRRRVLDHPLAAAFVVSLLIHLLAFAAWQFAERMGWEPRPLSRRIHETLKRPSVTVVLADAAKQKERERQQEQTRMTFVDVDPAAAAKEPPKDAKYYSAISSQAAQPNPKKASDQPEIDGKQDKIVRTFDAARTVPQPAQAPEEIKPPTKAEPQRMTPEPKAEPKPTLQPGALASAKPSLNPTPQAKGTADMLRPEPKQEPRERPRTIAAARAQLGMIAGDKVRQEGGVERFAIRPSYDVIASPFGAYDQRFIATVQARWYSLIDEQERNGMLLRSGLVTLTFKLHHDGSITDLTESRSTVGDIQSILCQQAILQPAKYDPWPTNLRIENGRDFREVQFTFYYN